MTDDQIEAVQRSFAAVVPISDTAAAIFYERLFKAVPNVRRLFTSDMREQGRKLMGTLSAVVAGLDQLDLILPTARALAIRHVSYGVTAEHYAPVGTALIETLREGLGAAFDERTEAAWAAAYAELSAVMIEAAYGGRTSAAA